MPSADATYYNIKRLHVLFAASALALLGATVWMIAADHGREWKVYQRTFRDRVEPWLTAAAIRQEQTDEFRAEEQRLVAALEQARAAVPDRASIDRFLRAGRGQRGADPATDAIEAAYEKLSSQPSAEARAALLGAISKVIDAAAGRHERLERQARFRRADFDEARSLYEAAVGQGRSRTELNRLQERVNRCREEWDRAAERAEHAAARHAMLADLRDRIVAEEREARQALSDHRARVARLDRALREQRPSPGKRLLRMPFVDALGRPLAVEQIWLPDLTIDYNFREVARFDRCVTCHQAIEKTAPGSPAEPACLGRRLVRIELAVSSQGGAARGTAPPEQSLDDAVNDWYGFALAPQGMLDRDAPTVGLVRSRTAAADAGLLAGDALVTIDGKKVTGREAAARRLVEAALRSVQSGDESNGEPAAVRLEVDRGLPHPYQSHPRLDLFVGSLSPHPVSRFGCTICHAGQGSATEFKFASHAPNDLDDRSRWRSEHGWFWNEHWDFPMLPRRFVQSTCLKCHHAVTDLAPSRRFPDPPAEKLLAGYDLIRRNGCFGCHEINGFDAAGRPIGPDMRLEPAYAEAALDLLADPALNEEQRVLARQVAQRPDDGTARQRLLDVLAQDGASPGASESRALRADSLAAVELLSRETIVPGTMRKVGSSLRDTAGRLDARFLDDWLADPTRFRPDTTMPRFYGMHEHLDGKSLDVARRFEAVEIRAVTDYLLAVSQPVEPLAVPPEVTEEPSASRGKTLFLTQGCLACHKHGDYPEGKSIQGPNLSHLGSKYTTEAGRRWLVSWIRDPLRHSSRTLMPSALLVPVPLRSDDLDEERDADAGDSTRARVTDPAADLAAYLLSSTLPGEGLDERAPLVEADLDELVLEHLAQAIPKRRARAYLAGEWELTEQEAQGDLAELAGRVTREKKLRYVGRRTIRQRGCFGCHDVPGFGDAQPIGPALSDWGRKQESLLAFEQVHRLLEESPPDEPDRDFYLDAVRSGRREGFIWQKLRAPRSFDYKKADNKAYHERLTMGRFTLAPDQREAIITFVLGLVSAPPSEPYVFRGDRRGQAVIEGRKVLDKYGCAECHTLEMERWTVRYDPDELEEPFDDDDFAFLKPRIDRASLEASGRPDRRGLLRAEAVGMPQMDSWGEIFEDVDDADHPMYYLNLWEPLTLKVGDAWRTWRAGGAQLGVSDPHRVVAESGPAVVAPEPTVAQQRLRPTYVPQLEARRPPRGGAFARLLFPHVLDEDNPAVMEAWGWVPPPLVNEGRKVQPAWLHDYLLEPTRVRPAAVLRMPKYNLSPAEAGKLVDYFAAVDGVNFPYTAERAGRLAALEAGERVRPNRLDDALRIVIDRTTFCAKCHLVGDFDPGGETQTVLGPRLDRVGRRLRPEYLRPWLANPKRLLPYTGMPVNFPPTGPPLGQDLFEGTSVEQLDAVVDLLLHYEEYMLGRTSIRALIEGSGPPGPALTPDEP